MKRSTLTLSILTALLVSACGGSSSNDEQTKDPTPPKVTPTKPSTPSTGHTSTTGNKGNAGSSGSSAGSSASSSSSSDPTPPISSGSAPSGGKPIVITSKTKIDEPPTPDENQEKTLKELAAKIAAAKKALEVSKKADEEAYSRLRTQINSADYSGVSDKAWKKHADILKDFVGETKFGLNNGNKYKNDEGKIVAGPETLTLLLESKKTDLGNDYGTWEEKLKKYKEAIARWEDENGELPALTETAKEKREEHFAAKKKLAELQVQEGLANAMGIKSEEDYYNAKKNEVDFQSKLDEKEAEVYRLELDLDQTKREIGDLEFVLNDLKLAVEEDNISDDKKEEFNDRIEPLSKQVREKEAKYAKLIKDKDAAKSAQKTANQRFTSAKDAADELKKALKYRGVAAEGDFSKKSFAKISKVAHSGTSGTDEKWTLTFADNSTFEIDTSGNSSINKPIKRGSDTYGSFENDSQGLIAYQKSSTNGKSIYGYIADQFYSVGEVTDPDYFSKPDALSYAAYKGKALLQADAAKGGSGLIADFEANVDFKEGKLKGSFSRFGAYDRSSTTANVKTTSLPKNLREDLGKGVDFHAAIKGNKFMTEKASDNEASVYGYFYGDSVDEMGGLVEYKNVFHGSFGGAK